MVEKLIHVDGLCVRRRVAATKWSLHCDHSEIEQVGRWIGLPLTQPILHCASTNDWNALRLAVDEWLLIGPPDARLPLSAEEGPPHSLVEVSDRTVSLDVTGRLAPTLLQSVCPLDFAGQAFPEGRSTRTLIGKITAMIWRTSSASGASQPDFIVDFARSFDSYMTGLLTAAAKNLPDLVLLAPDQPDTKG